MFRIRLLAALAAFALVAGASATAEDQPVYIEGAQYTATVDVADGQWRLLPLDGHDMQISAAPCGTAAAVPRGVWLIERDADGRPELRAPSTTALPDGHPGVVALRACGSDAGSTEHTLSAPQPLIDWLVASAGAVYVDG